MKLAAFMDFETFKYIKNADNKFWNNKKEGTSQSLLS